jgi:hypothetical protein
MTESLTYVQSVAIASGPSISKTATIDIEAYDVITAVAPKSTGSPEVITVDIQPGDSDLVNIIYITSDQYTSLTYTVDAYDVDITLDAPQMFLGAGQILLLGATCNKLLFTNAGTILDANIRVIVGRTAMED